MIEFNKKLMMDNISVLLKRKVMKIGELESQANVSAGYLSRLAKDENSKPSVELITKIAGILGVSMDVLLGCNLSSQNPTEQYLFDFLQKLNKDTLENKLDWHKETPELLSYYDCLDVDDYDNNNNYHPLFEILEYASGFEPGLPETIYKVGPRSKLFENKAYPYDDWFSLKMQGKYWLYLISVHEMIHDPKTDVHSGLELWLCFTRNQKECLCTTGEDSAVSAKLFELYKSLKMCIQLDGLVKSVIDDFMNDE